MQELTVTSPAFGQNTTIPMKYTCDGENVNPPLLIENIPEEAESLVLIVDDPDAPSGIFDHWVVWNILINHGKTSAQIGENNIPGNQSLNGFGRHHYGGPCPPPGKPHRYFFKVYALDTELKTNPDAGKKGVEDAMEGHVLAKGELVGLYGRP